MSDIRRYLVDGYWWLGVEHDGKLLLISRVGRAGDCLRF
jgi:hypothetical protein